MLSDPFLGPSDLQTRDCSQSIRKEEVDKLSDGVVRERSGRGFLPDFSFFTPMFPRRQTSIPTVSLRTLMNVRDCEVSVPLNHFNVDFVIHFSA